MRLVDKDEALELFPRIWNRVRRSIPGMLSRSRNWWELRVLFEPPGSGSEGGTEAIRRARDGRPRRGLRDLSAQAEVDRWGRRFGARGRRGRRPRRSSDSGDLALPPRHRLGGPRDRIASAGRPSSFLPACNTETDEVPGRRRALGAARRCRRGAVAALLCRGRGDRRRRRGHVLPLERRSLEARRRPGEAFAGSSSAPVAT